jgi:hypothetical protein
MMVYTNKIFPENQIFATTTSNLTWQVNSLLRLGFRACCTTLSKFIEYAFNFCALMDTSLFVTVSTVGLIVIFDLQLKMNEQPLNIMKKSGK